MRCTLPAIAIAVAAPVAIAWPACESPDLAPPVAIRRDAPDYPDAARENGAPIECRRHTRIRFTLVDAVESHARTSAGAP